MQQQANFWQHKSLEELSELEWESLCDGCGICCLYKFEDQDTGELFYTKIACKLLDLKTCKCQSYPDRSTHVPLCLQLTTTNMAVFQLLPKTCAYRRLKEGKALPSWHPLISKDCDSVEKEGISVKNKVISEEKIPKSKIENYIVESEITRYLKIESQTQTESGLFIPQYQI